MHWDKGVQSKKRVGRSDTGSRILRIAILIIVTYFLFEVFPGILYAAWEKTYPNEKVDSMRWIFLVGKLNMVSDPLIYLYNYQSLESAPEEKFQLQMKWLRCNKENSVCNRASFKHRRDNCQTGDKSFPSYQGRL